MHTVLLIVISILPAIFLLLYFEKQDKGRKEPRKLKWKIFWWGIFATFIAGFIEVFVDSAFQALPINHYIYLFLTAFVTAALIEEGLKLWVVKRNVFLSPHFDEVMDGITYAIIASLGFATLENILYVVEWGFGVGILRAVLSVPGHALFSGIMGYYIGKSKFAKTAGESGKLRLTGYAFAVMYHGTFNYLLLTRSSLSFLVIPLMVLMGFHLRNKIRLARFEDKVTSAKPAKFTLGRSIKIFLGTVFILFSLSSVIGGIMLLSGGQTEYGIEHFAVSLLIAGIAALTGYRLLKHHQGPPAEKANTKHTLDK